MKKEKPVFIGKKLLTFSDVGISLILGVCAMISEEIFRFLLITMISIGLFALKRFLEEMM